MSAIVKRAFDAVGAASALAVLSPVIILTACAVLVLIGRPVLFVQERPGKGGKPFLMFKFRTMRNAFDREGNPLPDEERLTRFGGVLRRTSLDEIPELWNVLRGDMSLVGPRPLLMEYLPLFTPSQARRHEVRPGMTGWAQVNGRNDTTWDRRLALDCWYVDHQSLLLDLHVLALTMKRVFTMEGIQQDGKATMEKFRGTGDAGPSRSR